MNMTKTDSTPASIARRPLLEVRKLNKYFGGLRAVNEFDMTIHSGELVGLIFDGNIESLAGDFVYEGEKNRAVAVHSSAMIEALRKVYGASQLANELQGN